MVAFNENVQSVQANLMSLGIPLEHGADGQLGMEVKLELRNYLVSHYAALTGDYAPLAAKISSDGKLDEKKLATLLNSPDLVEKDLGSNDDYNLSDFIGTMKLQKELLTAAQTSLAKAGLYQATPDGRDGKETQKAIAALVQDALKADPQNTDFYEKDDKGAVLLYGPDGKVAAKDGKPKLVSPSAADLSDSDTPLGKLLAARLAPLEKLEKQAQTMAGFGPQYAIPAGQVIRNGEPSPEFLAKAQAFFHDVGLHFGTNELPKMRATAEIADELKNGTHGFMEKVEDLTKERDAVVLAQKELKAQGIYKGEITGVLNAATERALYDYAVKNHPDDIAATDFSLVKDKEGKVISARVTGGAGALADTSSVQTSAMVTLKEDSTARSDREKVQSLFSKLSDPDGKPLYAGKLDGEFGPKSVAALSAYAATLEGAEKDKICAMIDDSTKPPSLKDSADLNAGGELSAALEKRVEDRARVSLVQEYLGGLRVKIGKDGQPEKDADGHVIEDPKGKSLYAGKADGQWSDALKSAIAATGQPAVAGPADLKDGEGIYALAGDKIESGNILRVEQKLTQLGLFRKAKGAAENSYYGDMDVGSAKSADDLLAEYVKKHPGVDLDTSGSWGRDTEKLKPLLEQMDKDIAAQHAAQQAKRQAAHPNVAVFHTAEVTQKLAGVNLRFLPPQAPETDNHVPRAPETPRPAPNQDGIKQK